MLFPRYPRGLFFGRILLSLSAIAALAGGCGRPYFSPANVEYNNTALVTVNDTITFYAADLVNTLDRSGMHRGGGFIDSSEAYDTLKEILIDSLVSLKASEFDLTSNPVMYREYERQVRFLLKNKLLYSYLGDNAQVDSAQVVDFYYGRPDLYTYKSRSNIAHIVLSRAGYRDGADSSKYRSMSDEELDSLIYRKLRVIKKGISDSLSFSRAAKTYSMDIERGKFGGGIGWIERQRLYPEIEELVYDKRVPLLAPLGPVATKDGVHLLFIYDRMFMGIPDLTAANFLRVQDYLRGMEIRRQATLLVDSMRSIYEVTVNDSAVDIDPHKLDTMSWVIASEAFDTVRIRDCLGQLDFQEVGVRGNKATATSRRQLYETIIIDLMLSRAAKDLGIANWSDVVESKKKIYQKLARSVILGNRILRKVEISDDEAFQYYEKHESDYIIERPLRIQHIVVEDSLLAEEIRLKVQSGVDILELADLYYPGEKEIRRAAADLGYIGPRDLDSVLYNIAVSSKMGQVTEVIRTQYGYHVVKPIDLKVSQTFDEAKAKIKGILTVRRRERSSKEWERNIFSNYEIEYLPVKFPGVKLPGIRERLASWKNYDEQGRNSYGPL